MGTAVLLMFITDQPALEASIGFDARLFFRKTYRGVCTGTGCLSGFHHPDLSICRRDGLMELVDSLEELLALLLEMRARGSDVWHESTLPPKPQNAVPAAAGRLVAQWWCSSASASALVGWMVPSGCSGGL